MKRRGKTTDATRTRQAKKQSTTRRIVRKIKSTVLAGYWRRWNEVY